MYSIFLPFLKGSMIMARLDRVSKIYESVSKRIYIYMGRNACLFMFFYFNDAPDSIYRVGVFSLSLICVRALGLPSY